jgi:hypothetical protein
LNLFGVRNHLVKLLDTSNPLGWLLEETLSDVSHNALVFSDFSWDTHQGAQLRRQVDILSFLTNFKQWLINRVNFYAVSSFEIINHVGSGLLVAMVEDVVFGVHVPFDLMHLVGTVGAVFGHHDGPFKLSVDKICIMSLASIIY